MRVRKRIQNDPEGIVGYKLDIERYLEDIETLKTENAQLKRDISWISKIRELEKAERDKENFKTTYNNYFLQIQILINQMAIEAPGAKKPWWRFW